MLRARLSAAGVKRKFLNEVVLPSWWEDSIALSEGGFREAASYVCAHLGYSLASLIDEGRELVFSHQAGVKYKKAKGVSKEEVTLATHYALGVARFVAKAMVDKSELATVPSPDAWRVPLLASSDRQWVCLRHILTATWALGIPVIHLKNLPSKAKKPDALTTMVGDRPVIVVLSARKSPSWIAFIVAHELGHIHQGHLKAGETLVDEKMDAQVEDEEEVEANQFAAKLLTGHSDLGMHSTQRLSPRQLAHHAAIFGKNYRIAPAVAALNYGFTTEQWAIANGAVSILEKDENAGRYLSDAMAAQLTRDDFSEDSWEWITRATSAPE